ncbi:MAG: hypothetical protein IJA65_00110 [Acholeplasmatales bacterium]|nr:hypothetical protein [Acholeplasmatales bacterium]
MTIKKLAFLVSLTTILFVQEELLTFIPNIQLTFLLIIVYGSCIGIKDGTLIILVHVLLDNLFMSSFNLHTIIPMFIGYELTLVCGYVLRNKNEFIISLVGALCSFIYCILFLITNIIVFDINPLEYFIADLPFEIILMVCTIVTVLFLYKPIKKVCMNGVNQFINKKEEEI